MRYFGEDDGRVAEFAGDFDGLGALASSSEEGARAREVVNGVLDGQGMFVFRQGKASSEASAPAWVVAGLELKKPIADRCAVQFCRNSADREVDYLADPVVKEHEVGASTVVVRARDAAGAGRLVEERVLEQLVDRAGQLPFRPEMQIRGNRIIAYPADHHTTIDHRKDLDHLMGLAKRAANVAA
ncbi:MAG: hypothetical protein U5K33_01145 [Halofilum sp. (in: g-proteobacteria)]|nr:hypothetical protein [Halofilum sp. (in: g-proteobacteria)]